MTSVIDSTSGRVFCQTRNCILKIKCLSFKGSLEDYVNLDSFFFKTILVQRTMTAFGDKSIQVSDDLRLNIALRLC